MSKYHNFPSFKHKLLTKTRQNTVTTTSFQENAVTATIPEVATVRYLKSIIIIINDRLNKKNINLEVI